MHFDLFYIFFFMFYTYNKIFRDIFVLYLAQKFRTKDLPRKKIYFYNAWVVQNSIGSGLKTMFIYKVNVKLVHKNNNLKMVTFNEV